MYSIKYQVVFYRQKEWNNNITLKQIAKFVKICIHELYRLNCWLPINVGYCLHNYNADSIRDFTSLRSLRTFTESVVFFPVVFQIRRRFTKVVNNSSA